MCTLILKNGNRHLRRSGGLYLKEGVNKMQKERRVLVLLVALCLLLCSCGQKSNNGKNQDASSSYSSEESPESATEGVSVDYEITDLQFKVGRDSLGDIFYYALLEIENKGKTNLTIRNGSFDIEDQDGHLVQTDSWINTAPNVIPPNEKGYMHYKGSLLLNGDEKDISLKPHGNVEIAPAPSAYQVSDVSCKDGVLGAQVFGRVTNQTNIDNAAVEITVVFYDKKGKCIGIGSGFESVPAGTTKSFSVVLVESYEGLKANDIDSYVVYAQ